MTSSTGEKKPMERTALIDGDIVAYKSAILNGARNGDAMELADLVRGMLAYWQNQAMCRHAVAALSCPTATGFRRELHPDYKGNRRKIDRPEDLVLAREIIRDTVLTLQKPRIEADDLMAILATNGRTPNPVIVTIDKDLRQVPGWHCNPDKEDHPHFVSEDQGMRHFCMQWLTGDSTDNYCGIPGVGDKKANEALPKYGSPADFLAAAMDRWNTYMLGEGGHGPIIQARLAWLLRASDWDSATGKIRLFTPERYLDGLTDSRKD